MIKRKIIKKRIKKIIKIKKPQRKDKLIKFSDRSDNDKQKLTDVVSLFCLELEKTFNVQTFLCGGTFLGPYRDGDFISHDDDIDINYYIGESNQYDAQKKSIEILEYFKSLGRLGDYYAKCHYHIYLPNNLYFVDIWPCWSDKNIFYTGAPNKNIYYGLNIGDVLPLRPFLFRENRFMIPNHPNNFAKWMWGNGWNISKKLRHGYTPTNVRVCSWH
jgi:hypothetical protein